MDLRSFLISLSLFLLTLSASAKTTPAKHQEVEELRNAVSEHVRSHLLSLHPNLVFGEDLFIEVGHLDSRLRLSACDNSLTLKINTPPHNSNRLTVKTSCTQGAKWTIYVPATYEIFEEVVVAARDIPRGEIVTQSDIGTMRLSTARFGVGLVTDPERIIGMELKRPLRSGSPMNLSYVKRPDIVEKGDSVVLESRSSLLRVVVGGTALDNGHLGKKIRVRNNQSQKVVDGLVIAPGKVQVASY